MEWIKTTEKLPEKKANTRYSQVPCLVVRDRQVEILVFNHEHDCWDGADGDDYECGIEQVSHWMPLPQLPKQDNEG